MRRVKVHEDQKVQDTATEPRRRLQQSSAGPSNNSHSVAVDFTGLQYCNNSESVAVLFTRLKYRNNSYSVTIDFTGLQHSNNSHSVAVDFTGL